MPATQLWSPKPQRPESSAIEKLNTTNADMVPGTWLQLSPTQSAAVSPTLNAEPAPLDVKEDLTLRSANDKFLSNNFVSRSSSMSSEASAPLSRHPPLGARAHVISSVERREAANGRASALGAVFDRN